MKKFLLYLTLILVSGQLFAQGKFDAKSLLKPRTGKPELVNDFAGILTADQRSALEQKLVRFDDSSSSQIAVVIIPELSGYDVSDYNVKLGRAWGVGGKEFNNGVVLLISIADRKLNIATGYGMEGALPDVLCKQIIDNEIVPRFKGQDYYRGIDQGVDAIIKATKGEYKAPAGYSKRKKKSGLVQIIFIVIVVIFFIIASSGGGGGGSFMSRRGYRGINGPIIFPGGGWFSSGGGGSGGGGGGGFGGFGGGSFGGGGASGSW